MFCGHFDCFHMQFVKNRGVWNDSSDILIFSICNLFKNRGVWNYSADMLIVLKYRGVRNYSADILIDSICNLRVTIGLKRQWYETWCRLSVGTSIPPMPIRTNTVRRPKILNAASALLLSFKILESQSTPSASDTKRDLVPTIRRHQYTPHVNTHKCGAETRNFERRQRLATVVQNLCTNTGLKDWSRRAWPWRSDQNVIERVLPGGHDHNGLTRRIFLWLFDQRFWPEAFDQEDTWWFERKFDQRVCSGMFDWDDNYISMLECLLVFLPTLKKMPSRKIHLTSFPAVLEAN